jgi:LmbE family N-acetylglucosaminyl deacetylase
MIPELNNPLILKVSDYDNLDEYISSLSKPSRKDLKNTLSKNRSLSYHQVEYDPDLVQRYMDLWASQPLSNGGFPLWGNWNSDSIKQDNDVVLFAGKIGEDEVAVHFIFRWGNYAYCNAPLYDKKLHPGLGKWMWIKLIEYFITHMPSMEYLDFVAPEGKSSSWHEVIRNREKSSSSGDFGYKWKFIPREGKIYPTKQPNYSIGFCNLCRNRWVYTNVERKKCKCLDMKKNLLVIAHPDDEAIFFGNWLSKNRENTRVVCVTGGNDEVRKAEFLRSMGMLGIEDYEIWDYEFSLSPLRDRASIYSDMQYLRSSGDWECVVTHGRYGEYGHIQHIEVHDMVVDVFRESQIRVFSISPNPISQDDLDSKILLNKVYESQYKTGFEEIFASLATGSDWYKHSVGFDMVRHESVVDIEESISSLNIAIVDPVEYSDFPFYGTVMKISSLLRERGHNVDIRNPYDDLFMYDVILVYTLRDAEKVSKSTECPFFFLSLDGTLKGKKNNPAVLRTAKEATGKSIRTAFPEKSTRDLLGNPLNIVHLDMDSSWYEIVRLLESHIIRAIISERLSTLSPDPFLDFSFDKLTGRLSFKYNGRSQGSQTVVLEDQYGQTLIRYSLELTRGNSYWVGFYESWLGKDLKIFIQDHRYYQEQWILLDI